MHTGHFTIMGAMTLALRFLAAARPKVSGNAASTRGNIAGLQPFVGDVARAEGWDVFDCGLHPDGSPHVEIQRVDNPDSGRPVFADDADAWQHVVDRARLGSALHLRALEMVDPVERLLIETSCGAWTAPAP